MIDGDVTVSYGSGESEKVSGSDLFYWPPGRSASVQKDAEVILFSPQAEHCEVIDHMKKQLSV